MKLSGEGPAARNEITEEAFSRFLTWLGTEPLAAAERYKDIHRRLVRVFVCWGSSSPEELADRTLDRVIVKADRVRPGYQGDPFAYILGVARNVRREDFRAQVRTRSRSRELPPPAGSEGLEERLVREKRLGCLERCLAQALRPEEGRLLLEYYREARRAYLDRKGLARDEGLSGATLRKRTQRYRRRLEACLRRCLGWHTDVTEDDSVPSEDGGI